MVRDGELLKFELVPPGTEGHGLMSFELTVMWIGPGTEGYFTNLKITPLP